MPKNESEESEKPEKQERPAPMPRVERKQEPSLEGLVKMKRVVEGENKFIHAHPSAVKNHKENGWKEV